MNESEFFRRRQLDRRWIIEVMAGPNMEHLGRRARRLFGDIASFAALQEKIESSNHEGAIIAHIYKTADEVDADVRRPFIELHFANVAALGSEDGVTTPVTTRVTMGFRNYGYMGALFGFACALDRGTPQASPAQASPS